MSFADYSDRREQLACAAELPPYRTVGDDSAAVHRVVAIGDEWSRNLFDGPFYRSAVSHGRGVPVVGLVFVQSLDGNTVTDDPSTLGGGATDKHLIYEGLSRVDADAVMAGAATAREADLVFSVWRPELVALRTALGKPRHPAQVVVTGSGALPWDQSLMLQTPELRVYVIVPTRTLAEITPRVAERRWITLIDAGEPLSMLQALRHLHAHGIRTISAVGGRRTAVALLNEGLVDDVYLTTGTRKGGAPHTPFYEGSPPPLTRVVEKAGTGVEAGVRFEHFVVSR